MEGQLGVSLLLTYRGTAVMEGQLGVSLLLTYRGTAVMDYVCFQFWFRNRPSKVYIEV